MEANFEQHDMVDRVSSSVFEAGIKSVLEHFIA